MNRRPLVGGLVCVLVLAWGCEREEPQDQRKYDPDIDAPVSTLDTTPDPTLAADQRNVSDAVERRLEVAKTERGKLAAGSPKQVFQSAIDALAAGNKAAFLACFEADEKEAQLLGGIVDVIAEANKFEKAMKAKYGQDAMTKAPDVEQEGPNVNVADLSQKLKDKKLLDNVQIEIDGDKATATVEGKDQALELVKKDGAWKIRIASLIRTETDEEAEQAAKVMETAAKLIPAVAQAFKNANGKIGQADYTVERINEELGQEIVGLLIGAMQQSGMQGLMGGGQEAPAEGGE